MWNQKSLKIFTKQRGTLIKNGPTFVCIVLTSVVRILLYAKLNKYFVFILVRVSTSVWGTEFQGDCLKRLAVNLRWAIGRPNAEVGPCLTQSINERQTRTDTPTSGVLKLTGRVEVCSIVWQNLTEPVGQVRRLYVCRTETNVDYNFGRCGVQ